MSVVFYCNINNKIVTVNAETDQRLSWVIYLSYPSTLQLPSNSQELIPLWVLLNEKSVINADQTSTTFLQDDSIITLQYALQIKYFRELYSSLLSLGIVFSVENTALILFSMHTWLFHTNTSRVKESIFLLMQHFPEYVTQPISLRRAYIAMKKRLLEFEKYLDEYHKEIEGEHHNENNKLTVQ